MKYLKVDRFLYLILGMSALAWLARAIMTPGALAGVWPFVKLLPDVVTFDVVMIGFFVKWMWKWPIFKGWLVPFPDLNGTWEGTIQTTWINEKTGERPGPIPTILVINQSFVHISCVMRTGEMTSYSYTGEFVFDEESGAKTLVYSYNSKPRPTVIDRSAPHDGTIVFEIKGDPPKKLSGQYWTARKTTGEVELKFKVAKQLVDLPGKFPSHPVTATDRKIA